MVLEIGQMVTDLPFSRKDCEDSFPPSIMFLMTDAELFSLNQSGLIPGPGETEEEFLLRVETTQEKFQTGGDWIPASHWDWVREFLGNLFDVKPLYIAAFYSNASLAPWQGAASWIEGRHLHSIQLRQALKKGTYLQLYTREEILAHEAVHAARSGFAESSYEEFFAYMTSEKKWRRCLGPILERPWEVWPFFFTCLGGIFWQICFLGAAAWSGLGFLRLIRRHRTLHRAATQIFKQVGDLRKTRAILFRLTDREIERFSQGASIEEYEKQQTCLRWRVIRGYLSGS